MKRILFGNETKRQIIASNCPGCHASHGAFHSFGCPLETCPKCGRRLLKCSCKALGLADSLTLVKAIADGITDKAEIHRALANQKGRALGANYYEDGCMLWIIRDVTDERDPAMAKEADEMLMADMGFRKSGNGYVTTAENVAKNMNTSVEEAHEVLAELQAQSVYPGWDQQNGPVN